LVSVFSLTSKRLFVINVLAHDGGFYETKAPASARRAEMFGVLFVSEKVRTGFYYYRCFAAQIVEIGNSLLSNFSIWHGGVRDGTHAGASPGEAIRVEPFIELFMPLRNRGGLFLPKMRFFYIMNAI